MREDLLAPLFHVVVFVLFVHVIQNVLHDLQRKARPSRKPTTAAITTTTCSCGQPAGGGLIVARVDNTAPPTRGWDAA